MEKIKQWLNQRGTYQQGVELLLQHTQNQQLVALFTQEGETQFKRNKLLQELKNLVMRSTDLQITENDNMKICPGVTAPGVVTPVVTLPNPGPVQDSTKPARFVTGTSPQNPPPPTTSAKVPGRWSAPEQRDDTEKALHDTWHPIYLEMAHLAARIYDVAAEGKTNPAKKVEAGQMAHRILALQKQVKSLYKQRDDYFVTGQAPTQDAATVVEPLQAWKKYKNAQRYCNEMKARLQKNPGDETAARLLKKHQADFLTYKALLKID